MQASARTQHEARTASFEGVLDRGQIAEHRSSLCLPVGGLAYRDVHLGAQRAGTVVGTALDRLPTRDLLDRRVRQ
jgi:hypothetical protein